MSGPSPDMPQAALPPGNMPVILRIILAIMLGFPGIVGLVGFGFVLGDWLYQGFQFQQSDLWIMPVVVIGAESFICFSVLTVGVVLRYARWKRAPVVSLVLAVLAAVVIVLGYQLILDCLPLEDGDDRTMALVFSIIGLLVIAVPPLLHWWKARRGES